MDPVDRDISIKTEKVIIISENKSDFYELNSHHKYPNTDYISGNESRLNAEQEVSGQTKTIVPEVKVKGEFHDDDSGSNSEDDSSNEDESHENIDVKPLLSVKCELGEDSDCLSENEKDGFADEKEKTQSDDQNEVSSEKETIKEYLGSPFTDDIMKEFSCHECLYKTNIKSNLRRHMAIHIEKKQLSCRLCDYKTKNRRNLKTHRLNHEETTISCIVCSFKTDSFEDFKEHSLMHAKLAYEVCPSTANSKSDLENYAVLKVEGKALTGDTCSYQTICESNFIEHHLSHGATKPSLKRYRKESVEKRQKKIFYCEFCSFKTMQKGQLYCHELIDHKGKIFRCKSCKFKTDTDENLSNHRSAKHKEVLYTCEICPYKSNKKRCLKSHMRVHSDEKPFTCEICPYRTNNRLSLKSHILLHTGKQPFSCDVCSFKTVSMWNLKEHKSIHTGEKKYLCEICSYQSIRRNSFKNHLLTHTGEKPHSCPLCPFKTKLKCGLKRHLLTHKKRT